MNNEDVRNNMTVYVSIRRLVADYDSGVNSLHITQRQGKFVDEIIKETLFYANDNNKNARPNIYHNPYREMEGLAGWHGYCYIVLAENKEKNWIIDGGHRTISYSDFMKGTPCKNFLSEDERVQSFLTDLAADMGKDINDSFTYQDLILLRCKKNAKYARLQEFFEDLTLGVLLFGDVDAGVAFIAANRRINIRPSERLNARFATTNFYALYIETSICISKYNPKKGVTGASKPSWYDEAPDVYKTAYVNVCEGMRFLKHSKASVLSLLLKCTELAKWDKSNSETIMFDICLKHEADSELTAMRYLMNTLLNMSVVSNLLEDNHKCAILLWTGGVNAFGHYYSGQFANDTNNPLISDRFIKAHKAQFNKRLMQCLVQEVTNFKNIKLNGEDGIVFNSKYVSETAHQYKKTEVCACVMTEIYNEIKEASK